MLRGRSARNPWLLWQHLFRVVIGQHGDKLPGIGPVLQRNPGDLVEQLPIAPLPAAVEAIADAVLDRGRRYLIAGGDGGVKRGRDRQQPAAILLDKIDCAFEIAVAGAAGGNAKSVKNQTRHVDTILSVPGTARFILRFAHGCLFFAATGGRCIRAHIRCICKRIGRIARCRP